MKQWIFQKLIIKVCGIKVGRCSHSTFSNVFSLETARPIEAKFHVDPLWDGEMKLNTNGLCHVTKMAAMSIYGKNFLLWNQKVNDLETVWGIGYSNTTKFFQLMNLG